jgi:hypothetical protein
MDIYVQSFLNSATKLTISVNTTTTFAELADLVWAAEGTTSTIQQFYINNTEVDTSATMSVYAVTSGTYIGSSNTISELASKVDRQVAKLNLAQLRRQSAGNTTTNYYRVYNIFDVDLLADKYISNTATVGTTSTLVIHRPWLAEAPVPAFSNPTLTIGSAVTTSTQSPFVGGGNSYSFISSTDSYIETPASSDWAMGTGDFTVEWFSYQTTLSQFQRVFTVGDYPAIDFGVSIESGTFYFWSGGDADTDYNSASATTINTWYHWAVVRSGTTLSVYRNGTLRGSSVSNTDNINDTVTPFVVGNTNLYATNAAFVGFITNFRLVKGLAVYTGDFTVPTSALTATATANPYGGSNTQAIPAGATKLLLVP